MRREGSFFFLFNDSFTAIFFESKQTLTTEEDFLSFIDLDGQEVLQSLISKGLRIGLVGGVWMVGSIDEIRMPVEETLQNPILVDTKTRSEPTLPPEPQKRTGRLQLMCYKYLWELWDSLVTDDPFLHLLQVKSSLYFIKRNPTPLSLVFQQRYEFQVDHSEIGEELFSYDPVWFMSRIRCNLEFWLGEREASYVPKEENWKCRTCQFVLSTPPGIVQLAAMLLQFQRSLKICQHQARYMQRMYKKIQASFVKFRNDQQFELVYKRKIIGNGRMCTSLISVKVKETWSKMYLKTPFEACRLKWKWLRV